ncbi:MAG: hypothetical protein SFV19_06665 [Rhodospirillaceae bacterium]|nr:hypothetical protein [Rhodospirillaceae bacterium]
MRAAQDELRRISPRQHPELVSAIQAKLLALQGRGGDTEIAHVTPGEVVIPRNLQTPAVMGTLAAEAMRAGIDPRRYTVGHRANSVNPRTGKPEFAPTGCDPREPGECFNPHITNYFGRLPVPQGPEIFPVTGKRPPPPPKIQISVDPNSFIGRGNFGPGHGAGGGGGDGSGSESGDSPYEFDLSLCQLAARQTLKEIRDNNDRIEFLKTQLRELKPPHMEEIGSGEFNEIKSGIVREIELRRRNTDLLQKRMESMPFECLPGSV